jgi:hypothetical protein
LGVVLLMAIELQVDFDLDYAIFCWRGILQGRSPLFLLFIYMKPILLLINEMRNITCSLYVTFHAKAFYRI